MKLFENKKQLLLNYGFFALWGIAIWILHYFSATPLSIALTFLGMIFLPGFSLARIFKIDFKGDSTAVLWMGLGFVYVFGLAFLSTVLKININTLVLFYTASICVLLLVAFFLDTKRPAQNKKNTFNIRAIISMQNILPLAVLVYLFFVVWVVAVQGASFRGDPIFHLSIVRKAFEGGQLTPENLNYIKSSSIHIVYGYPIWHIVVAIFAKIARISIFTAWGLLPVPLTVLAMIVWYSLSKKIFTSRNIALLALLLFTIFTYNMVFGYLFERLPVPDTLNQYLFLPLTVVLALRYIFDKTINYKTLIVFSLLLISMAAIHFTQYVYFLLIMFVFMVAYTLFGIRQENYRQTLVRIFAAGFANLIIILPFLGLLESNGSIVSKTVKAFMNVPIPRRVKYDSIAKISLLPKFAYVLAPLILLFARKNQKLIILLSVALVAPLAYWSPIRGELVKYFGLILMERLFWNVTWNFMIFALIMGFVIVLFDRLLVKVNGLSRIARYIAEILLFGLAVLSYFKQEYLMKIYNYIFSPKSSLWLNENFIWLDIVLAAIVILLFIWQQFKPKIRDFFALENPRFPLANLFITFIFVFIFFLPGYPSMKDYLKSFVLTDKALDFQSKVVSVKSVGGETAINFIKENIPAKSIMLVFDPTSQTLSTLIDNHMVAYPKSRQSNKYNSIFKEDTPSSDKIKNLKQSKAEYVFVSKGMDNNYFGANPELYIPIYQDSVAIYKIDLDTLNSFN